MAPTWCLQSVYFGFSHTDFVSPEQGCPTSYTTSIRNLSCSSSGLQRRCSSIKCFKIGFVVWVFFNNVNKKPHNPPKFTEVNENLVEVGGGCIYQSFGLVQFVLRALKEAAFVFPLAFGGSAWAATRGKNRHNGTVEHDGVSPPVQQAWWSLITSWPTRSSVHSSSTWLPTASSSSSLTGSCPFPWKAKGKIPTGRGTGNNGLSKCSCEVQSMDMWACGQSWLWASSAP